MIQQLTSNIICWLILALALVCYQHLWEMFLRNRAAEKIPTAEKTIENTKDYSQQLINCLPLLGLLGTVLGLMQCFSGMASNTGGSELLSDGIADALFTTQLGLVCALPAWLLQAAIKTTGSNAPTQ